MIEKLKDLKFISLKECDNLDSVDVLYVDYSENKVGEKYTHVFSKTIIIGELITENINDLPSHILELFVERVINNNTPQQTINIDINQYNDLDIDIIDVTIDKFLKSEIDNFVIVPSDLDYNNHKFNIIKCDILENEIIFGNKNKVDEPGIILLTNEEGISDINHIKIAVESLGFFPEKTYNVIKLT